MLLKCPLPSAKICEVFQGMLQFFHLAEPKFFSLTSQTMKVLFCFNLDEYFMACLVGFVYFYLLGYLLDIDE